MYYIPTPAEVEQKLRARYEGRRQDLVNRILRALRDADYNLPLVIKPGYVAEGPRKADDRWCDLTDRDQQLVDLACAEVKQLLLEKGWAVNVWGRRAGWFHRGWIEIDWRFNYNP